MRGAAVPPAPVYEHGCATGHEENVSAGPQVRVRLDVHAVAPTAAVEGRADCQLWGCVPSRGCPHPARHLGLGVEVGDELAPSSAPSSRRIPPVSSKRIMEEEMRL